MNKIMMLLGVALISGSSFASVETCYQVSANEGVWSRTPESICVVANVDPQVNQAEITLKSGLPFSQEIVANFNYALLSAIRCLDCNQNVYGMASSSNSAFRGLTISFNGKRDVKTGKESGVIYIGNTQLFYRSAP